MRIPSWNVPARSAHRRLPRLLTALTLALALAMTGAAATAPPAAAASVQPPAPAVNLAPHHAHSAFTQPAPPSRNTGTVIRNVAGTSEGGYVSNAIPPYTEVSSTWVEPAALCTSATSYASFLVGLDGYGSASAEQTGTLVYCYGGVAYHYGWSEIYPAAPVYYSNPVAAGDTMNATVTSTSAGNITMTLADYTRGWKATTTANNSSLARASAEILVEESSASLPVATFGSVTFTNSTINNIALVSADPVRIGTLCGPISGGTFTCRL